MKLIALEVVLSRAWHLIAVGAISGLLAVSIACDSGNEVEESPVPPTNTVAVPTDTAIPQPETEESEVKVVFTKTPTRTPIVLPTSTDTPEPTATYAPIPSPTLAPTATPTEEPAPTATFTPLPVPSDTPTAVPTDTPEPIPTVTNSPELKRGEELRNRTEPISTVANSPEPTATFTPLPVPSDTPTAVPTDTPEPVATNTPIPTPTDTPTATATFTPIPPPTDTPTNTPTATVTFTPTITPTYSPSPVPTLEPVTEPEIVWSASVFDGTSTRRQVEADIEARDGIVYVGSQDNNMYALYASSGDERWVFDAGSNVTGGARVSEDGKMVYFGTQQDGFFALNTDDGTRVWSYDDNRDIGEFHAKPTLHDDLVIAATNEGVVYAFDADEGTLEWSYPTTRGNSRFLEFEEAGVVEDDIFYIGNEDGTLHAIDTNTGLRHTRDLPYRHMNYWRENEYSERPSSEQADLKQPLRSQVVSAGDKVFFGNEAGEVYMLETGKIKWIYNMKRRVRGGMDANEEMVVAADTSGEIVALDTDLQRAHRADDDDLYKTPQRLWSNYTDRSGGSNSRVIGGPIIVGERVFVLDQVGGLYIFNALNGKATFDKIIVWAGTSACTSCASTPAFENDMIFVGTAEGRAVGIRLPPDPTLSGN